MYKIVLLLCLAFGLAKSFNLASVESMDDAVAMLCSAISTQPGPAASFIDRMQKMLNEHQQKIQERLPRTYAYMTKQENKDKLKAGGQSCKTFFDGLKAPLSTDLQKNPELLQFIQQMMGQHIKDIIHEMQQQSG